MQKGQISLDLIFSLLILIIFITTMFFFVEDFKESKENINLENKLNTQAITAVAFINSSRVMLDTDFESKLLIERINYKNELIFPTININNDEITFEHENKSVTKKFNGEKLSVNINMDYLVVKNE